MIKFIKSLIWRILFKVNPNFAKKIKYQDVDHRRFWDGEIIGSPAVNVLLFKSLGKDCVVVTFGKESRDCIFLEPQEKIKIFVPPSDRFKLTFSSTDQQAVADSVIINFRSQLRAELKGMLANHWHTVTIDSQKNGGDLEVHNNTKGRVFLAHPILETVYKNVSSDQVGKQNIIMILLDSVARDSLSVYNSAQAEFTPNIGDFFKDADKYNNCFSQSEWTLPSLFSVFLSKSAVSHGMTDLRSKFAGLSGNEESILANQLRKLGYSTFAFSTIKVFQPALYGHSGFDRFIFHKFPQPQLTNNIICQRAIEQLQSNFDGKNFLFLHFLDGHEPWTNTDYTDDQLLSNFRIANSNLEYDFYKTGQGDTKAEPFFSESGIEALNKRRNARLFTIDLALSSLFNYLQKSGLDKTTAVVLFADHGYQYLNQNAPLLSSVKLRVPLLIKDPLRKFGDTHDNLSCLNLDLGPTILKLAGGSFANGDGKALPPYGDSNQEFIISESIFKNKYKAVVRNKDHAYHFCCIFDNISRKINFEKMVYEYLFESDNEYFSNDKIKQYPKIVEQMKSVLVDHLEKVNFLRVP